MKIGEDLRNSRRLKEPLSEMERELPKIKMTEDKYTHASFAASFWLQYKLVSLRVLNKIENSILLVV